MKKWEKPVEKLTQGYVGESQILLVGDRGSIRRNETNLGNLVTDAIVKAWENFSHKNLDGKVQLSIMNSGGIRADVPAGEVKNFVLIVRKLTT